MTEYKITKIKLNMQSQFRKKIGETAYTSNQIIEMLCVMDLGWCVGYDENIIREYVKKERLFVDMEKNKIEPPKNSTVKYWIPKSNIEKIIDGFNIAASPKDFEDVAYELNYEI